eukprot:m.472687 g.472687  ORF g.472687 m.472687 type:complete len:93 (+) comp33120_c0_seq1:45-323(+)
MAAGAIEQRRGTTFSVCVPLCMLRLAYVIRLRRLQSLCPSAFSRAAPCRMKCSIRCAGSQLSAPSDVRDSPSPLSLSANARRLLALEISDVT